MSENKKSVEKIYTLAIRRKELEKLQKFLMKFFE